MSDKNVRRRLSKLEGYVFDSVPWNEAKPLAKSRVAIVTTAGLTIDGNADWNAGDQGFNVIPKNTADLTLAHYRPNFDRTGWVMDKNVVFPIDRLDEMAEEGVIGSVANTHVSFMGAQPDHTLETIRIDSGPAAAQVLREDNVDVILLTPI